MDHGSLSVMQALDTAASMGKGLIFLGDDSAFHASGSQSQHGASTFFDLMGFDSYSSNGSGWLHFIVIQLYYRYIFPGSAA